MRQFANSITIPGILASRAAISLAYDRSRGVLTKTRATDSPIACTMRLSVETVGLILPFSWRLR